MVRKIYHGSKDIIEKPVFGYGKTYNDYGLGFYCTDSLDMAKEWGSTQAAYFNMERNKWQRGDLYIVQILDEEMKADDSRLR